MIDDRDMDGIPDRIDSSFNTPEEVLEIRGIKRPVYIEADQEKLERLAQTDIPFYIRKTDDEYRIICDASNAEKIKEAIQPPKRLVR